MRNLRELPKFRDGLSYIYVEKGRVEQQDKAVAWWGPEGIVAIPAASLAVLLLGPGTTITHAAIKSLSECGCTVCWVGQDCTRFYAAGTGETRSADHLAKQVQAWADAELHMRVVRSMYEMRFPEVLPEGLELKQIRGMEGVRVRDTYARLSRETGVPWHGRNYERNDWKSADPINRALSAASPCLYGVCHAAIVSAGYSPALGFIHTGKQLSFAYDIADLYKMDTVVPAAFKVVAESEEHVESRVRILLREQLKQERILERAVADLQALFRAQGDDDEYSSDGAKPSVLWDPVTPVAGGVSHGCDGVGESPPEPSR